MKKLMFVAGVAAMMASVGNAGDDQVSAPYVYQIRMNIVTTTAAQCEGEAFDYPSCGEAVQTGTNQFVRVNDNYQITGFAFGCSTRCANLKSFGDVDDLSSWSIAPDKSSSGIILWDAYHGCPITPTNDFASASWRAGSTSPLSFDFLNVIKDSASESEFKFLADVWFPIANDTTKWEKNTFDMVGAGFGQYATGKSIVDGKMLYAWVRQSGYMAGTMSAPLFWKEGVDAADGINRAYAQVDANGTVIRGYGWDCSNAICGGAVNDIDDRTAAYGTWAIAFQAEMTNAFGRYYGKIIAEYIPDWVKNSVFYRR